MLFWQVIPVKRADTLVQAGPETTTGGLLF